MALERLSVQHTPTAEAHAMRDVTFTVPGAPVPGGSKKVIPRAGLRYPLTVASAKHLLGLVLVIDDNDRTKQWKKAVRQAAVFSFNGQPPLFGPLRLDVRFQLPRPKAHFTTAGVLRESAPVFPTKRPDATKLLRAVEDALTGVVWLDDAQVVEQHVSKAFVGGGEDPDVNIVVCELPERGF